MLLHKEDKNYEEDEESVSVLFFIIVQLDVLWECLVVELVFC